MKLVTTFLTCLLLFGCDTAVSPDAGTPALAAHVAGMTKLEGFYTMYRDENADKLFLQINDISTVSDTPFIYVSSLARGVGSNDLGLDRGQLGATRLVRFHHAGDKVLLIEDNTRYTAKSDNADERNAVAESFARSALWGFSIVAKQDDSVLVDATDFFLRDAHQLSVLLDKAKEGSFQPDPSRSAIYMPRTRAFPDNVEIEAIVTLVGQASGEILETVSPDDGAITVHQHHSLIRLPPPGFEPVEFDPRAGYIDPGSWGGGTARDYASPIGEPLERPLLLRHRLKKRDPDATLSDAVKPIVYYVDRGAPEPIRTALIEGASWWNEAFSDAGYRDAFRVELLPKDADPLDIRYNVIQWVHRSTRGWSYGSSVRDPRTGEILKGHVSLGSLRVRQDYLLAEGLLAPYRDETVPTALLDFALARIRQLAAHEVGHTLGLAHNFAASANDRASVMDYPHPLVRLDANGQIDVSAAYDSGLGSWDRRAILYGYQDFPDDSNAQDARDAILRETYASGQVYVDDMHARGDAFARSSGAAHPQGSLWDNGADAVAELQNLMRVRQHVLARFSEHNIRMDRPLASIENVLVPMYLLHRYQLQATSKFIGGRYFTYALRGDGQIPTTPVSANRQIEAIDALLKTLDPSVLRLRPELVALIAPVPPGVAESRELFPRQTGYLFDPLAAAATAAGLTLDTLLDSTRGARMINAQALDPAQPGFDVLLERLLNATWYASAKNDAEIRRVVNNSVLERLLAVAAQAAAQPQVRALAYDQIVLLNDWLEQRIPTAGPLWRAHYRYARAQIRRFVEDPAALPPAETLTTPPGSPIG